MQNDDSVTKITWEQLLEEYFFSKNLRPDTEWSYCKVVRVFREFIGDILPGEVTVRDVQRYRRYVLKEQKRREVTWNNKVAHLRAIMGFGIKMKLLPQTENPLVEASVASTEKKKKTLSDNQMLRVYLVVQRFAEAEEQNMVNSRRRNAIYPAWYWLTVLDVLRYTGMRFNQLKHIRVRDVCPDESIIDLKLEGSKTHREWGVPLVAPLKVSMEKLLERARQCGQVMMTIFLTSVVSVSRSLPTDISTVPFGRIRPYVHFSGDFRENVVFLFHHIVSDIRWQPD